MHEPDLDRVIAVGFPTSIPEHNYVYDVRIPKYFVHSTNDEFGPREEFANFYESVPEPKHLDWVSASDHFFKASLDQFEAVIERIGLVP